jgi:predicted phage-related endonuclease
MAKVILADIKTNHDAWVAQKACAEHPTIGSGDIASICGADDYRSALRTWAIKKGREAPDPANDHMLFGQAMEPVIAGITERKLGVKLRYGNTLYAHDDYDWARATPDYFAESPDWDSTSMLMSELNADHQTVYSGVVPEMICEIKNVGFRSRDKWIGGTPLAPQFQTMWQMGVTGHRSAIIAPLIGGDIGEGFIPRFMTFDEKIFAQIFELASKFMWHLEKDIPPAPGKADLKLVERLIGSIEDSELVVIPDQHVEMIAEWKMLKERKSLIDSTSRELEKEEKFLRAKIRAMMGKAAQARCGKFGLKAKLCTRVGYVAKPTEWVELQVTEAESD